MSTKSIANLAICILLIFAFWASQTCLIVCKVTSLTKPIANNDTQEALLSTQRNSYNTHEGSILTTWNAHEDSRLTKWYPEEDSRLTKWDGNGREEDSRLTKWNLEEDLRLTKWNGNGTEEDSRLTKWNLEEASRLTKWNGNGREDDSRLTNLNNNDTHVDPSLAKWNIRGTQTIMPTNFNREGKNSTKLSKKYGRILSTRYTKESVGGWWPSMGMKEEEVSMNVSCTMCNITSSGARKKKSKTLLSKLYEKLFVMTHARLHPMHHRPVRVIVVDQGGHGNSRTVQGAIDMVRLDNKWRIQIIIRPGTYREKVYVPYRKPFITFQGSGSAVTVITWNARAGDKSQGGEILGTFASASVAIDSDYFVARDITFQNTSPPPLPGAQGMQAVALRISGDKAAFIDCRMLGAQDTLFDHVGRHFFLRCYIEGAIDFIFGDGRSLYLNCELHANAVTYGAVAASQRNSASDNTGFSFVQCKITGTGLLYLGRAWGQYARILFAFSYFDNIIIPDGWYDWGDTSRRETVFFGEYKCWGPGSQPRWRVSWSRQLSYQQARPFLSLGFINGHKWFNILT